MPAAALRALAFLALCWCQLTFAAGVRAEEQQLSRHRHWLNLLYYEPSGLLGGELRSAVDQAGFFLAPHGAADPAAELVATPRGLFDPQDTGDAHARCRFPARFAWLDSKLQLSRHDLPEVHRQERDAWMQEAISSVQSARGRASQGALARW